MVRKYTFEQVKQTIESSGWTLVSSEYVGCKSPLQVICPQGHQVFRTFDQIKVKPQGCIECKGQRVTQAKTKTVEEVQSIARSLGFTLIGEYVQSTIATEFQCDCGHVIFRSLSKLKNRPQCANCRKGFSNIRTRTEADAVKIFAQHGFTMTGTFSDVIEGKINSKEKVAVLCPIGHETSIHLSNFLQGKRCKKCANRLIGDRTARPDREVKVLLRQFGYTLIDRNPNKKGEAIVQCPEGHQYKTMLGDFKSGQRCRQCYLAKNRGENHPQWRKDLTDEERALGKNRQNLEAYKVWRKNAHITHGSVCKKCGSKSHLHVHHIQNWADHPELRFDVDNAVILCRLCHKEFHFIYGQRKTSRSQLNEFLISERGQLKSGEPAVSHA